MLEHISQPSKSRKNPVRDNDVRRGFTSSSDASRGFTPSSDASRGFTLVELLVVIGIIALLISILLPVLSKARDQANIVKCLSNVTQLDLAAIMFANEHHGYLPIASDNLWAIANDPTYTKWAYRASTTNANGLAAAGSSITVYDWASALIPYLGGPVGATFVSAPDAQAKVFRCPADQWLIASMGPTGSLSTQVGGPGYTLLNNVLNGGTINSTPAYQAISYGYNYDIACVSDPKTGIGYDGKMDYIDVVGGPTNPVYGSIHIGQPLQCKLARVYQPQATLLFADCGTRPRSFNNQQHNMLNLNDELVYTTDNNYPGQPGVESSLLVGDAGTFYGISICPWLELRIPTTRHNGKLNVAFCDGHGETISTADYHRVRISPYNWAP
jgi:prepilin-type N-terminal cleavage/methylation domain-containing protein/prepilin-type processing-associated H-X9-DG protein